jgi:hypothetical protein
MKFIPYPVIAGLTTGTGLLLIKSQYKPFAGHRPRRIAGRLALVAGRYVPPGTFCVARFIPRLLPAVFPVPSPV